MKINVSKLFDANKVIEAFIAAKIEGIEDFVTNLSDLSDQVLRALRQRLTLADNIDCETKVLAMTSGVSVKYLPPEPTRRVKHIVPSRSSNFANPVLSTSWRYTTGGEIEILCTFPFSPATDVTFILFY